MTKPEPTQTSPERRINPLDLRPGQTLSIRDGRCALFGRELTYPGSSVSGVG